MNNQSSRALKDQQGQGIEVLPNNPPLCCEKG